MSTLTKVLIVLLSVFALFLCGVVVTYVANADNYKQMYERQRSDISVARNRRQAAEEELAQYRTAAEQDKQALEQRLSDVRIEVGNLQAQLEDARRENNRLVQQVANSADTVKVTSATQQKMLEQAQADQVRVTALQAEQTRLERELTETNQALLERVATIETLRARNRQLVEANEELEARTNQYLQRYGQIAAAPQPVTPVPGPVRPAETVTRQIDLNGRIVRVDMPLAEISIGAAAGVRENMTFHIIRGTQFVADLEVLNVDTDRAVGRLMRVQTPPRAGDTVTTNL